SGFPDLAAVADGDLAPEDLRRTSLLGSTTMFRVLAGAYQQLSEVQHYDDEEIVDFFSKLAPHMTAPITVDSLWVQHVPDDIFVEKATAPRARRQDLKTLRDALVQWAVTRPAWL